MFCHVLAVAAKCCASGRLQRVLGVVVVNSGRPAASHVAHGPARCSCATGAARWRRPWGWQAPRASRRQKSGIGPLASAATLCGCSGQDIFLSYLAAGAAARRAGPDLILAQINDYELMRSRFSQPFRQALPTSFRASKNRCSSDAPKLCARLPRALNHSTIAPPHLHAITCMFALHVRPPER